MADINGIPKEILKAALGIIESRSNETAEGVYIYEARLGWHGEPTEWVVAPDDEFGGYALFVRPIRTVIGSDNNQGGLTHAPDRH